MNFLQHHTLKITPLCPVHIGSGETFEPTGYVIDDDALYEFDSEAALAALSREELKQLSKIVEGPPGAGMLKEVQYFFHSKREKLAAQSIHAIPIGHGVAGLYQRRIGQTAQREKDGRQIINKLGIERTFYNPESRGPIIPGSSIKGAIRTALLDAVNQGGDLVHRYEKSGELQQRLFQYGRDLHKDPMRLVKVADAGESRSDQLPTTEIRFAVNRKKEPVQKNGRLLQSQAEEKGLFQMLECLCPVRFRAFDTSLTFHRVERLNDRRDKLPAESLRWDVEAVARACNAFYIPIFEKETAMVTARGYVDPAWIATVESLWGQGVGEALRNNRAFLLRLGRHSGADSVTLNGVRSIKIMRGKKGDDAWEKTARTLWLAAPDTDARTGMTPFGWVLVEIDPGDEPPPWQEKLEAGDKKLRAWQEVHARRRRQWAEEMAARRQADADRLARERIQEAEREASQRALEAELAGLSTVAREFVTQAKDAKWSEDKDAFWREGGVEAWLERLSDDPDAEVLARLKRLLDKHFTGLLQDPDKTKGKKAKPAFSDRQRNVAKRVLQLLQRGAGETQP